MMHTARKSAAAVVAFVTLSCSAVAQDSAELAMELANPVSSLISVPFQLNYDQNLGPFEDGSRITLNVQPVVPFSLNEDWNLISRTILPIISQDDVFPGAGSQSGTGDTVQSLFFSPKAPTDSGWIWGAGPVLLIPTGTDDLLGSDKWGIGPTGVALKQQGPWTYGALANHIISIAGNEDRQDINATFLQPFVNYTTPDAWSYIANIEATRDWENKEWSIPLNLQVAKVLKLGNQLVQVSGGVRAYLDAAENGPDGFGFRVNFVLLFPR